MDDDITPAMTQRCGKRNSTKILRNL